MALTETIRQIETALTDWPEISIAVLFGSLAEGRETASSDLDLAVQLPAIISATQKMKLMSDLANQTGRPVDLVDLRDVGQPLLGEIVEKGIMVRGGTEAKGDLLFKSIMLQEDFAGYQQRILQERRKAWIEP
ncbi:type VII toxin-antitoxin system MntA family adenylyltransferase antitoxin [Saccharospirillum impatiens]|uniref:type VII toxin-antitoxin system MntA family adenylyltransferase antitoxin n=1 Tax=Saccharospirillum impatiens TaxID=169438 RepID=UPI0004090F74|nr:nucleotidyltransferase domain-containing protein [Saccharospirillum impatiens]